MTSAGDSPCVQAVRYGHHHDPRVWGTPLDGRGRPNGHHERHCARIPGAGQKTAQGAPSNWLSDDAPPAQLLLPQIRKYAWHVLLVSFKSQCGLVQLKKAKFWPLRGF